jgi:3-methyladenine DNA glycosylase Mpg
LGKRIWIEDHGIAVKDKDITAGSRIGIDYAEEDAARPYRFVLSRLSNGTIDEGSA